ncbi:MAG: hypothetical protein ACJAT2_000391 [Bacteriovoracaceae bacterium]
MKFKLLISLLSILFISNVFATDLEIPLHTIQDVIHQDEGRVSPSHLEDVQVRIVRDNLRVSSILDSKVEEFILINGKRIVISEVLKDSLKLPKFPNTISINPLGERPVESEVRIGGDTARVEGGGQDGGN